MPNKNITQYYSQINLFFLGRRKMSVPLLVIGGLTALGSYLNQGQKQPREQTNKRTHISTSDMPNGRNVYNSNRVQQVRRDIMHEANEMYEKSECSKQTGVVPPFWKNRRINETGVQECVSRYGDGGGGHGGGVETFESPKQLEQVSEPDPYDIRNPSEYQVETPDQVSNPYFNNAYSVKKPFALDRTLPKRCDTVQTNFGHQNMTPFFKGSGTNQNMDFDTENRSLQDYTGQNVDRIEKKEINGNFFEPSKQNPFIGTNDYIGTEDRYVQSIYRTDELPFEQKRVGKTSVIGNGTYRLHEPNVDELRARSNPKMSYKPDIIPGKSYITRSGKMAAFTKNRPERFRTQCADDLIVTTGEFVKPQMMPRHRAVHTHRHTQNVSHRGPVGSSEYQNLPAHDYDDISRRTVKETTLYSTKDRNARPVTRQDKMSAHDYDDISRRTIKETTLYSTKDQNARPVTRQDKVSAHDYDDISRRTIKETTLYSTKDQNARPVTRQDKVSAHDYDDTPAPTLKQLSSNHTYSSGAHNKEINKPKSYENSENVYIKGLKGLTNVYRPPTQTGAKKSYGEEDVSIRTPKERISWNKRHEKERVYDPYKRVIPFQRNKREDSVVRSRFMPDIYNVENQLAIQINRPTPVCERTEAQMNRR
jgi:hypothetical protein